MRLVGATLSGGLCLPLAELLLLRHVIHLDLVALRVVLLNQPLKVLLIGRKVPLTFHRGPLQGGLHGLKLMFGSMLHQTRAKQALLRNWRQ